MTFNDCIVFAPYLERGISERCLKKVWDCETWTDIHTDVYTEENKLIHKKQTGHSQDQIGLSSLDRAIKQPEIDAMCRDFENGLSKANLAISVGLYGFCGSSLHLHVASV